jgi:anti-sigma factor RsiW
MSCSPFDLRDYFFGELPDESRRQVNFHLKACAACQDELDHLRLTQSALLCLRDEEIPQRIGFVSDKVFEPSTARRWWGTFWGSTARLAFASAAMLSIAIIFSALHRPATAPMAVVDTANIAAKIQADVSKQVAIAVAQAVSESEARQAEKTAALLTVAEKRRQEDVFATAQALSVLNKQLNIMYRASNTAGASQ